MLHGNDVPWVPVDERVVGPVATIAGAASIPDRDAPDRAVIEPRPADGHGVPASGPSRVARAGADARAFADAPGLPEPALARGVVTVRDAMAIREFVR